MQLENSGSDAFTAVQSWWRAWVDGDWAALAALTDADFVDLDDRGTLRSLGGRALAEEALRHQDDCRIVEWELTRPLTKRFDDVVVCTYAFRIAGTRGGRAFAYEGWATDFLGRSRDQWIILSHEGAFAPGGIRH